MIYKENKINEVHFLGKVFSLPKEWSTDILSNITEVKDGTHDSPNYVDSGIPFITSKNLNNDNTIDWNNIKYISKEEHEKFYKRSNVAINDIVFGMIGTIGSPVVIKENFEFSIKNLALIKSNENNNSNFIRYQLLASPFLKRQFECEQKGGVLKFVKLGDIRNFKMLKISKTEQDKIVQILDQQQGLIDSYKEKLSLLEEQEAYYQDELLSGRLRIRLTDESINYATQQGWYLNDDLVEGKEKEFEEWIAVDFHSKVEFYKETDFETFSLNGRGILFSKNFKSFLYKDLYDSGMGKTILKKDLTKNGIPVYSATEEDKYFGFVQESSLILNEGDLVIPARGNSIGFIKMAKNNTTTTQTTIYSKKKTKNNSFYVYNYLYFLKKNKIIFNLSGGAIPQLTVAELNDFIINLPEIEEKNLIVSFFNLFKNQKDLIKEKIKVEEEKMDYLMDELLIGRIRVK